MSFSVAGKLSQKVLITINYNDCVNQGKLNKRCEKDFRGTDRVYLSVPKNNLGERIIEIRENNKYINLPVGDNIKVYLYLSDKVGRLYKTTFFSNKIYSGNINKLVFNPEYKISRKSKIYLDINTSFALPKENTSNYVRKKNINAKIYFQNGKMSVAAVSNSAGFIRLTQVIGITQKDLSNKPAKYDFWKLNNLPVAVIFTDINGKKFKLDFDPNLKTFGVEDSLILKAKQKNLEE